MSQILAFQDRHAEAQMLLPWYVTDRLDEAERAAVTAHLADCAACRDDLARERTLAVAVASEDDAPAPGWAALAARLDGAPPPPARRRDRAPFAAVRRIASRPQTLRWAVAAQFAALLVLGAQALTTAGRPAEYRALGDAAAVRAGNALVMFRPDTTEARFRRALQASGARLIDGPTAAGAYVLDVPGGSEGPALAKLRRDAEVTMAEPIEKAPAE